MRKELIVSQDEVGSVLGPIRKCTQARLHSYASQITALSGNITEVADFENKFLRSLEVQAKGVCVALCGWW